jgi:hypothetical protein
MKWVSVFTEYDVNAGGWNVSVANKGPFLLFTHRTLSGFFSWKKDSLKIDPASAMCEYRSLPRGLTVCIHQTFKHLKQPAY